MTPEERKLRTQQALTSARMEGCTCSPDIRLEEIAPSVIRSAVAHDDWCPLSPEDDESVRGGIWVFPK